PPATVAPTTSAPAYAGLSHALVYLSSFSPTASPEIYPLSLHDALPISQPHGSRGVVVQAFLAHHQGMSLVALANAVLGHPMVQRLHADPRVQATAPLLQERAPRHAPITQPRPAEETRVAAPASAVPVRR